MRKTYWFFGPVLAALIIGTVYYFKVLRPASISEIVAQALPSIVSITTFDDKEKVSALGSGFILSKDGLIATNYHVIEEASHTMVKNKDDVYLVDDVVEFDKDLDLAILKIEPKKELTPIKLGNSDGVRMGDSTICIGNPLGFNNTISRGLISSIRTFEGTTVFQTSAAISHGSSGGVMLNDKGEVVGITTLTSEEGQNINFAIPVNYIKPMLNTAKERESYEFE